MENMKSKVLIVGSTGDMGRLITKACLAEGHPTFLFVRDSTYSDPEKAKLLESFHASGANILPGCLEDYASVVEAVKKVDVVISAVGDFHRTGQMNLIKAIKEVGTIKRFFPAEFAVDFDRCNGIVEPAKSEFQDAVKIRRAVEAAHIPYTYVVCGCFHRYFVPCLGQSELMANDLTTSPPPLPPRDQIIIYGDGNNKAVFVQEEDAATYTIKTMDDPRTLNKTLYFMPPSNTLSVNELVGIWEKLIDKTLEKVYVSEEELLNKMSSLTPDGQILLAGVHFLFIKENLRNFEIGAHGVEATQLYPDVKYTTVEDMLRRNV